MISTFLGYQLYGNNLAQALKRTAAEPTVSKDQAYYNANIGKVKTVDDLVDDYRLLSYATKAYGLADMTYAKSLLTKVLKSDLSDPKSFANSLNDSRYKAFAAAFGFSTTGTIKAPLQTASQQAATESLFQARTTLSTADATAATKAYETAMSGITSLGQLEKNPAALGYVLIAYGIDAGTATSQFEPMLESDLADSGSALNKQRDSGYLALAQAFNAGTNGVAVQAQTAAAGTAMTNAYMATIATTSAAQTAGKTETAYVSSVIANTTSVSALLNDSRVVAYITKAYGLPAGATKDTIAKALQSDTTAKTSFANRSPYPSYLALAKGFNFTSDGVAGPLPFQSPDQRQATMQLYMQRAAGDTTTAAAATAYYAATIGTVHSIADLQKDPKLTSYVLTAYGIDPKTPSATVASILNQTKSVDTGYLALAQAFNARSDGTVASGTPFQSTAQQQSTIQLFGARAGVSAATAATATAYYTANIGKIHSVGDLLADPKLLNYALTAFAIDTKTSAATLTAVLENTGGVDDSYKGLATDFAFGGDGLAQTVTSAQTAAGTSATTTAYMATVGADADAQTAAATETAYFTSRIGQVKTIADLLGDSRLKAYVTQAFGLSASLTTKTITSALTSDLGNPYSVANVQGGAVLAMAKAFAFTTAGTPSTRAQAQTSAQQDATIARYDANAGVDSATQSAAAAYYRAHIGAVQSVGDLESDPKLLSYVETAYGLDSTTSATTLASLLEARQSLVETAPTASLLAMKQAFNVDAQGNATTAWAAQSAASVTATTAAYMKNAPSDKASQAKAQAATAYYKTAIGSVTSVSGLLNDPKLVAYLEQAYAIPATTTTDSLRKILTSDVTDNKSVANSLGAATEALAAAFNFGATGLVATVPQAAQSKAQLDALQTAYIQNAIETEAGVQNPGIKLALYLQFNASKITDAYSILADKQLTQIFHTILGLPATASNADIDAQAKTITDKINLADLKNPKKLLALIQRFSVLYDLNPPASTAPLTSVSTLTGSITASNPLDVTTLFS